MVSKWQNGTVAVRQGHLGWHRTGGDLPPLVMAHGLTDNGLCWRRLAAALADSFDVIMIEARGHGGSSAIPAGVSPDPAQDLCEAVIALGVASPVLVGHSVGARAAAGLAALLPTFPAALVLEDPPLMPPFTATELQARRAQFAAHVAQLRAKSEAELMAQCRVQSPTWHLGDLPDWAAAKHQVDPAALPGWRSPWQADLAAIRVPTLILAGEPALGSMVSEASLGEAGALNSRITAARIAGAGHNVRREKFDDYLAVLQQFLHHGAGWENNR
jgi:N-formylmaleamate deformylase